MYPRSLQCKCVFFFNVFFCVSGINLERFSHSFINSLHTLSPLNHTLKSGKMKEVLKLLISKQVLFVSTFRTVWRVCILMLGCETLTVNRKLYQPVGRGTNQICWGERAR